MGESNKSSSALSFLASCTVAKGPLKFQQEIVAATETTFLHCPLTVIVSGMLTVLEGRLEIMFSLNMYAVNLTSSGKTYKLTVMLRACVSYSSSTY